MGITIAVITATNHNTAVSALICFVQSFFRELIFINFKHLLILAYNCNLSKKRFLCNDNSSCIPLNKVCDGKADCPKGDDESSSCAVAREECKSNICPKEASCQHLPSGPVCICPKGYNFNATSTECEVSFNILSIKCSIDEF